MCLYVYVCVYLCLCERVCLCVSVCLCVCHFMAPFSCEVPSQGTNECPQGATMASLNILSQPPRELPLTQPCQTLTLQRRGVFVLAGQDEQGINHRHTHVLGPGQSAEACGAPTITKKWRIMTRVWPWLVGQTNEKMARHHKAGEQSDASLGQAPFSLFASSTTES